jgi:hypothetical protein
LEDPGVEGGIILKSNFKNYIGAWIGFVWLSIETGGQVL